MAVMALQMGAQVYHGVEAWTAGDVDGAWAWNIRPFATLFGLYVELIRNTPFLVQLFFCPHPAGGRCVARRLWRLGAGG